MNPASAIYTGHVRHRRLGPHPHTFTFPLFMMYLDLDELPSLFERRWLWGNERRALASFRRGDHFGDPAVPLDRAVRDLVERESGWRPDGPVRLLTHLRYAGHVFNPVSFYFCHDRTGELRAVAGEVTNIPWKERFVYVGHDGNGVARARTRRYQFRKVLHVSPFFGMDQTYRWAFTVPGPRLTVQMDVVEGGTRVLDATLSLARREISTASLAGVLVRYPLMTAQVVAGIHFHALRVWWKGNAYHPKPDQRPAVLAQKRSAA